MGNSNDNQAGNRMERNSFLVALALVTILFLSLLKPFFGAILWACIIGLIFFPVQQRLSKYWGDRPNLSALVTLILCVVICIVPILFIFGSFLQEGASFYQRLQSGDIDLGQAVDRIKEAFPVIQQVLDRFNLDLSNLKSLLSTVAISVSKFVAKNAVQFGQGTMQWFISLGLMLYIAFFMLRDGTQLSELLIKALPLGDERERLIFKKFAEVARATIKGNLVVAIVQGALGGFIFWFIDIPGPILWGVVMVLLSLIPLVGASLIWLPVAIYLFAVGELGHAVLLTAFGVGVIGLVDNFLRPILVGRDTKLPDYVILLSTLGGLALFGINGFVVGPLLAAVFVAFWGIFIREFNC